MEIITIIISFYNQKKYIKRALDSCFKQTYPEIQLVIVDDKSDFHQFDYNYVYNYIIEKKKDNINTFKIIQNNINLGTVKSLNNILREECDGVYVVFLDGDDQLLDNCLVDLYNLISKDKLDIVGGKYYVIDNNENMNPYPNDINNIDFQFSLTNYELYNHILKGNLPFKVSSSLIRLKTLKRIGYIDSDFDLYHDRPLILDMAINNSKFGFIDNYTSLYRSDIGISHKTSKSYTRLLSDHIKLTKKHLIPNKELFKANEIDNLLLKQEFLLNYLNIKENNIYEKIKFLLKNKSSVIKVLYLKIFSMRNIHL